MNKLSDSEVILAAMTPEEAREFNQGNKENTLIYRAAKAKAKRFLEEKEKKLADSPILQISKNTKAAKKAKKVAKKIPVIPPKPDMVNGHSDWDTDTWLEEIDPGGWSSDEDKRAGLLEFELADEYWQDQFQNYQNNGGTLNFQQFMQMQIQQKVNKEINKRIKNKMRTEGIVEILGLPGNKI